MVAVVALFVAAPAARATSYVMATDAELLERADVVALGRVVARENVPDFGRPVTDYQFEIERLVKGFVPVSTLMVRVPGGRSADGRATMVYGAPELRSRERALLFLAARSDGTYAVIDLALGAFREVAGGGRPLLLRSLEGATEQRRFPALPDARDRARSHQPRDLARFVAWLADRERGELRETDYFLAPEVLSVRQLDAFQLTTSPSQCGATAGNPVRWFEFDDDESIPLRAHSSGLDGFAGGGFAELEAALATWNDDPESNALVAYAGKTQRTSMASIEEDGFNIVQWDDPLDDIDGSFDGSGILAVTWVSFNCTTLSFGQGEAHALLEADIVTQDGLWTHYLADFDDPVAQLLELLGHEMGHVIGVGHACGGNAGEPSCAGSPLLSDALMRAFVHSDDRGALLNADDRSAVRALYGGEDPVTDPPAAPTELTAVALSATEIELRWQDNATDEMSFELQERTLTGDFVTLEPLAANLELVIVVGVAEGAARAYRIRAVNDAGASAYSNEAVAVTPVVPGPCVADDETLCLSDERFRFKVSWRSAQDDGEGHGIHITSDTGYFWFFNDDNVELIVKALAACGVNGHRWVFAGALTNVQVAMVVADTETGDTKLYTNALGTAFQPILDTAAFATCP